jgi:hypothetical protein
MRAWWWGKWLKFDLVVIAIANKKSRIDLRFLVEGTNMYLNQYN